MRDHMMGWPRAIVPDPMEEDDAYRCYRDESGARRFPFGIPDRITGELRRRVDAYAEHKHALHVFQRSVHSYPDGTHPPALDRGVGVALVNTDATPLVLPAASDQGAGIVLVPQGTVGLSFDGETLRIVSGT